MQGGRGDVAVGVEAVRNKFLNDFEVKKLKEYA